MWRNHDIAEGTLGKQFENVREGRVGIVEQRKERIAKDMFHPRSPGIRPHLLEDLEKPRSGKRAPVLPHMAQRVVSERLVRIRDIHIDKVSGSRQPGCFVNAFGQIAMGVDEGDARAVLRILPE